MRSSVMYAMVVRIDKGFRFANPGAALTAVRATSAGVFAVFSTVNHTARQGRRVLSCAAGQLKTINVRKSRPALSKPKGDTNMKFKANTIKRLIVGIALGAVLFAGAGATASAQDRHDPYYGGGQHGGNRRGGILGGIFGGGYNRGRASDRHHRPRDDRRDRRHHRNERRNNAGYYGYGNNGHRNDRYNDAYYGNRRRSSRNNDYDRH